MTLQFHPHRRPVLLGDRLLSFPTLGRVFEWPDGPLTAALKTCLSKKAPTSSLSQPLQRVLLEQGVLSKDSPPTFALDLENLRGIPAGEPFLFPGDLRGGFRVARTGTPTVPCAHCLVLRYLAGRRASPELYQALTAGHQVSFEPGAIGEEAADGVMVFGKMHGVVKQVLPVPGCPRCRPETNAYTKEALNPSLFSPIREMKKEDNFCSTTLPDMRWLSGEETVGAGAAWHSDPEIAERKAVHEALERYAAHFKPAPAYRNEKGETREFSLKRTLLTEPGSVSTGLACRERLEDAIADGTREVCERDALARYWLALDAGRVAGRLLDERKHGSLSIRTVQLESHGWPTVLAWGRDAEGGMVFGSACNELPRARRKAIEECLHNHRLLCRRPSSLVERPTSFWEHASYYWVAPERFPTCEFQETVEVLPFPEAPWWAELTPSDLARVGLHVVRVQIPGLLHIPMSHCDWPDVLEGRYPTPVRPHPFA